MAIEVNGYLKRQITSHAHTHIAHYLIMDIKVIMAKGFTGFGKIILLITVTAVGTDHTKG